ncbi:hypothetical protein PHYBLDRAFT_176315 [Phycomyces blakesleeanus NRRL 1555(-)]|uniref:Uncharacterized protein n=1 Tax=Phycomyces blakesleeanus (strain ATCC 8743b / DSM 1359 / FGSC 10004 / NBRC 33097 / NRRL 1555) TaxID=763407 RepID=A0A167J6I2_PHYB8|nr:hypothetical protein PHYBLDRAFT_176315 [Phycomyces blakesleeanus NRRL 1555(-)]OAD65279.1 hypothetical protein PHYBLDRAFT_176315 [Phycomyces blakesleeanus NRRL 1555(-)]|eukprot:XP_018283319.1 hypothetical protein PHYBLDRAFT_176315 [Phycomyces blakesleeanus NRRL 1555(-)]
MRFGYERWPEFLDFMSYEVGLLVISAGKIQDPATSLEHLVDYGYWSKKKMNAKLMPIFCTDCSGTFLVIFYCESLFNKIKTTEKDKLSGKKMNTGGKTILLHHHFKVDFNERYQKKSRRAIKIHLVYLTKEHKYNKTALKYKFKIKIKETKHNDNIKVK